MTANGMFRLLVLPAVLAAAMALAACGSDSSSDSTAANGDTGASTETEASDSGGSEGKERLKVALPTVTAGAQLWTSKSTGAFEDAGLEVETTALTATTLIPSVIGGQADLGIYTYPPLALVAEQGKETATIYSLYSRNISSVMAGPESLKSPDELADVDNCQIATLPAGTEAYYSALVYSEKFNPDCKLLQLATPEAMAAAVFRGDAAAAVASYGAVAPIAVPGKGRFVIDTSDPKVAEQYFGATTATPDVIIFGSKQTLEDKRAAVVKFIEGMDAGYTFMEENDDQTIAETIAGEKELAGLDTEAILGLVKGAKPWLPIERGFISPETWKVALPVYEKFQVPGFKADLPGAQYDAAVDMSFYEEALGAPEGE